MKAQEIMEVLYSMETTANYSHTCDTLKAGDPEKEVKKVAVTMFGTPDLIEEALKWGTDMLIVHEPMYYLHGDNVSPECTDPIVLKKVALANESGLAVYRYHDHMHHHVPDMIGVGQGINPPKEASFCIRSISASTAALSLRKAVLSIPPTPLCRVPKRPRAAAN